MQARAGSLHWHRRTCCSHAAVECAHTFHQARKHHHRSVCQNQFKWPRLDSNPAAPVGVMHLTVHCGLGFRTRPYCSCYNRQGRKAKNRRSRDSYSNRAFSRTQYRDPQPTSVPALLHVSAISTMDRKSKRHEIGPTYCSISYGSFKVPRGTGHNFVLCLDRRKCFWAGTGGQPIFSTLRSTKSSDGTRE